MRKGFLIHEKMRKFLVIYEEAVSHIWFCNSSLLDFLINEEILFYIFLSVQYNCLIKPATSPRCWVCVCVFQRLIFSTFFNTNLWGCVSCCCGCSGCSRGCCHHWYILTYNKKDNIWAIWAVDSYERTRNPFQKCKWLPLPKMSVNFYWKGSLGQNNKNEELSLATDLSCSAKSPLPGAMLWFEPGGQAGSLTAWLRYMHIWNIFLKMPHLVWRR